MLPTVMGYYGLVKGLTFWPKKYFRKGVDSPFREAHYHSINNATEAANDYEKQTSLGSR